MAAGGCVVAGMSSGGCVAYELASQLADAGVDVRHVLTIDRNPFAMSAPLIAREASNGHTDGHGGGGHGHGDGHGDGDGGGDELAQRLRALDLQCEARGEGPTVGELLAALAPDGGASPQLESYARRYVASHRLIRGYTPSAPLGALLRKGVGGLTLFKAAATPQTALAPQMRQVEIGGCDHYTILQKPAFTRAFVSAVGEALM